MKILLTGGSGMVGRNILEHQEADRYEILAPSSSELNLLEQKQVQSYLRKESPDFVIHAAGRVGGIQANMSHPVEFLTENIQMGMNVISSSFSLGVKNLINLSSSCMYPKDAENPLSESMILGGKLEPTNEGYALAKTVCTRLCEYISKQDEGKLYKTIIPCNLYGRHDKFDPKHSHLIPAIIRKIYESKASGLKEVEIWGDGMAKREFMCASDLASFVFCVLDRFEQLPQNINVGLGHDYTILEYYRAVADVLEYDGEFVHDLSKPVGMRQKLVDITLLKEFGWKYNTELIDGINQAYDFFKEGLKNEL